MLRRMIAIALLAIVLLTACAPAVTPAPTEPAVVPVEPTAVPVEPAPEPIELLMWSEWCGAIPPDDCAGWNDTYCDGTITEPDDLGERYVEEWHKLHPEYQHIDVKCIIATYGGGRIGTELTAMVRAGVGPDIYTVFGGRSWLAYEIGIDLDKYISEEDKADFLDYDQWVAEDGTAFVLPGFGMVEYPVANKQLIERACAQEGFECAIPEPWSVMAYDEYLEIAEAIKNLDNGSYIGILWGISPSSQHMNWIYFAQAGIPAYRDGEFTGFPGGEIVLTELLRLFDEGYLYPDVAGISDGDGLPIIGRGKIGITMARESALAGRIAAAVNAGETEPWDMIPLFGIQFLDDVTPLMAGDYFTSAGFVADGTPEEVRTAAVSFMMYVNKQPHRGYRSLFDAFLPLYSQIPLEIVPAGSRDEAFAYIEEYGIADHGTRDEIFNLVRTAHAEMLTAVFLHTATPEEGLAQFRATILELSNE